MSGNSQRSTNHSSGNHNSSSSRDVLSRVDVPIAQATGLPNQSYVSEQSFLHDREQVMGRGWCCIGFYDQLPEPGYVLPIDFMGLPLLIARSAEDTVRVFHNVCSHRGLKLVDEASACPGAIKCPYHSWTYGLDGQLKATPNIGGYGIHTHAEFDRAENGLKEIRSKLWIGAIFVNLSGDAIEFEDYIEPVQSSWNQYINPDNLEHFVLSEAESHLELTVKSNWKLAVENFLESYHLPTVHPELNRISPLDKHYYLEMAENSAGQGSLNYTRIDVDGTELPVVKEWPEASINRAEYPALYPNTFLGIHADQLFIQYLQPLDQHTTVEHVRIYYYQNGATDPVYRTHRSSIRESWKSVFEEDIFAVERMQAGRASPAFGGGAFSPVMDEPTHHFHKWVARKLDSAVAKGS